MIDRSKTLARVTRECLAVHDKPTWANLAALMTEEERAAFHGKEVELPAEQEPQDSALLNCPEDVEPNTPHIPVSEAPRPVNPYEAMRAAEQALNDARQELRDRRTAVQASRVAFGKALEAWNLGAPVMNHEQQARAFIAQSQADRAAKAAASSQAVWHPGITRTAAAMAGGGRRAGGGNAFRRGIDGQRTYTREQAAAVGYRVPPKREG